MDILKPNTPQLSLKDKKVFINFSSPVDWARTQKLKGSLLALSEQKPSEFVLMISSNGGEVLSGITLYNFLKALSVKITTYNMGNVDSIANVIFLAGNERFACPNTSFLFHGVKTGFPPNQMLDLNQIKELESSMTRQQEIISGIVAEESSLNKEEINEFFTQGKSIDTAFAMEKGIINEVKRPVIGNSFCINIV